MVDGATIDRRFAILMKAAQAGDDHAYAQLLREITPRLRVVVRRQKYFLGPEDIEDLVQDVLLSIHAVRATYDPERPFMPWVIAIVKNRLVDGVRRYARGAAHEVIVEDLAVTFASAGPNTSTEEYGDPEALRQAIQDLPLGQRTAIEMLKLREMSLKEASAASGMSVGALKVATHRAMSTLRKMLVKIP